MTLVEIRWICELFEKKNMSKAAGVLYVSQPALSQCLQRVERRLGFPLFHRSNKGLVPTEKGILFHQAAASILDTYDRFLAQAELLDLKKSNHITIGMAPYISSCCSVEIIQKAGDCHRNRHSDSLCPKAGLPCRYKPDLPDSACLPVVPYPDGDLHPGGAGTDHASQGVCHYFPECVKLCIS